jgi:hypothetical protein
MVIMVEMFLFENYAYRYNDDLQYLGTILTYLATNRELECPRYTCQTALGSVNQRLAAPCAVNVNPASIIRHEPLI